MSNSIQLRRAEPDDFAAITALLQQSQLPLAGVMACQEHFLLAVQDDSLLGCAALEPYGTAALLRSVAVRAEAQGQGVGREVVQQILGQAAAEGIQQIVLLTTTAAEFFLQFGFQAITREEVPAEVKASVEFQGACPSSAVVMRLELTQTESPEVRAGEKE